MEQNMRTMKFDPILSLSFWLLVVNTETTRKSNGNFENDLAKQT